MTCPVNIRFKNKHTRKLGAIRRVYKMTLSFRYDLKPEDAQYLIQTYRDVYDGDSDWYTLDENEQEFLMDWRLGLIQMPKIR